MSIAKTKDTSKARKDANLRAAYDEVMTAFYNTFCPPSNSGMSDCYCVDAFDAYVIACFGPDYFKIPYTRESDSVNFANRNEWEKVKREDNWVPTKLDFRWLDISAPIIEGAIKLGADEWTLDVLGVPFGGPYAGKDVTGQRFTPDTKIHQDYYKTIPAFYYHSYDADGTPQDEPVEIGTATYDHQDERGHWYKVVLNQAEELAQKVWNAAKQKLARASSGTIAHIMRYEDNGDITNWPVVEMTLTDGSPGKFREANSYAVALPVAKMHYSAAKMNLVIPAENADNTTAQPITDTGDAQAASKTAQSESGNGNAATLTKESFMEITEEKLQQIIEGAVAKAVKTAPAPDTAGTASSLEVTHDEADTPFRSFAEQAFAVKMATVSKNSPIDPRLKRLAFENIKAASGANESIPVDGGYLLEPTIGKELITPIHEDGPFSSRARSLPVGANSNFGYINGVDETSRATGSRWGGVRGYRLAEADSITASRPKFRRINWELKKYAVLMYATDELLMDAAQFSEVARVSAGEELNFMVNDDILNGAGIGGPLGILNSGALISVARQDANKILHADILNMWQRMLPRFRNNAVWFVNSEAEPQLDALYFAGLSSGVLSPFVTYGPDGVMRIKGKPVIVNEFSAALGTAGDILLANMDEYLTWEKGEVQAATSIHIAFLTDEQAFRYIYRCDGQTTYSSPITPYKGTNTQSAFVTLLATS